MTNIERKKMKEKLNVIRMHLDYIQDMYFVAQNALHEIEEKIMDEEDRELELNSNWYKQIARSIA